MKIMIAYDGSKHAEAALRDLSRAGLPEKAQALVLTVTTHWKPLPDDDGITTRTERAIQAIHEQARAQALEVAGKGAAALRARFPGWKVAAEAVAAGAAEGILDRAAAWKPDLLVMGSHGRTALGRLLLGSISQKVLHHAPCDLRISRLPKGRAGKAPRVLVAVDGSAGSDGAVAAVAARAWPAGTRIRAVSVLDEDGLSEALKGIQAARGKEDPQARWVERKSAAAVLRLAETGAATEAAVLLGDPRIVLLREARDWDADVLFVGSRGLAGLERFVLGSVSSAVAAHAPCAVEVVRKRRAGSRGAATVARPERKAAAAKS